MPVPKRTRKNKKTTTNEETSMTTKTATLPNDETKDALEALSPQEWGKPLPEDTVNDENENKDENKDENLLEVLVNASLSEIIEAYNKGSINQDEFNLILQTREQKLKHKSKTYQCRFNPTIDKLITEDNVNPFYLLCVLIRTGIIQFQIPVLENDIDLRFVDLHDFIMSVARLKKYLVAKKDFPVIEKLIKTHLDNRKEKDEDLDNSVGF